MNAPAIAKIKSQRSEPQNSPSEVRAAYCYFHEKRVKNAAGVPFMKKDGTPNPRYGATFMFPKLAADPSRCANYLFLWGIATEAAKKMWPQNVDAAGTWVWPTGAQFAVKDGDVPFVSKPKPGQPVMSAEEAARKNAWRRGYWIVEAENFLDPGPRIAKVVNGQATDLPAKTVNGIVQYKSGDFGFVNIHAYAYQNETFGVNFGFDGFLFTRPGEAIGSSGPRSAEQMFGAVAGTVATPAPAMPGMGAPSAGGYAPPPTAPAPAPAPQPQQYAPAPGQPPAQAYAAPPPAYAPPAPPAMPGLPPAPPMPNAPAGLPPMPPPSAPGGLPPFPAPR